MAKFRFEAKAANGKEFKGEVEAASEAEARIKIRAQRMVPLRIVSAAGTGGRKTARVGSVKAKDLQIFTRQLATLIGSGVPILQAMEVLSKGRSSPNLNLALNGISNDISQGRRLGDALAEYPRIFDRFYVNMVRAAEESGNLDQILNRLAAYIEKSVKLKGKVKGAMVYPAAIVVVAFLVVAGLMIFVIPKFQDLFKNSGSELPAPTKIVVALSDMFTKYWYLIIGGFFGGIFLLIKFYESDEGRKTCDRILIDVPLMGDLLQKNAIARFSRTLSTLLGSGVGIMEAMDIGSKVVGNYVIELTLIRAKESITQGKSLTVPLAKERYIPHMVTQMIGVGEATGNLDAMLSKVADFYEDEVDVAVGALTSMMEPLLMVVLGAIIAFIVIAMYLPIFNLASAVAG